jgi:hypothetical protein
MSLEPDFIAQKGAVEELIKNAGHKCIFFPKFHCELNFIERYWGSVPIEPNRTELLVRFGFGSSNLSSGSGSVHQISVQVRVRFIKPWFRFGSVHQISVQVRFGSLKQRFGSGSVRFIKSQFRFRFGSVQSCDVIFYI